MCFGWPHFQDELLCFAVLLFSINSMWAFSLTRHWMHFSFLCVTALSIAAAALPACKQYTIFNGSKSQRLVVQTRTRIFHSQIFHCCRCSDTRMYSRITYLHCKELSTHRFCVSLDAMCACCKSSHSYLLPEITVCSRDMPCYAMRIPRG